MPCHDDPATVEPELCLRLPDDLPPGFWVELVFFAVASCLQKACFA